MIDVRCAGGPHNGHTITTTDPPPTRMTYDDGTYHLDDGTYHWHVDDPAEDPDADQIRPAPRRATRKPK